MEESGFRIFRNRLPQWRLDGGIYFVSWSLFAQDDELDHAERTIVAAEIKRHKDILYRLDIFVVMDNQAHALLQTLHGVDLGKVLKFWKGTTSRYINFGRKRTGTLWNKDSHTQLLDGGQIIQSRRNYIYQNPFQRWGIDPSTYQWLEQY